MLNVSKMEFTWYLLTSWAVASIYWACRPKLNLDIALFIFLVMSIAETVLFTTLTLSLNWITYPKESETFINILIIRHVLKPILHLFAATAILLYQAPWKRWLMYATVLASRTLITWVSVEVGLYRLVKINVFHMFLMDIALVALACTAAVWFTRFSRPREVPG
jgi:hypothetical protein